MHVKTVYVCERCNAEHDSQMWVFDCYTCGKEICEDCMYGWGVCQECAKGKTREFLEAQFNKIREINT